MEKKTIPIYKHHTTPPPYYAHASKDKKKSDNFCKSKNKEQSKVNSERLPGEILIREG